MKIISKTELTVFFMWLCGDLGKSICLNEKELKAVKKWCHEGWIAPCKVVPYGTVGGWMLDHNSIYGGWQIQEVDNAMGGIDCPLGHKRHSTKALYDMICFARSVIPSIKREES